jgi:hypothetical protein
MDATASDTRVKANKNILQQVKIQTMISPYLVPLRPKYFLRGTPFQTRSGYKLSRLRVYVNLSVPTAYCLM